MWRPFKNLFTYRNKSFGEEIGHKSIKLILVFQVKVVFAVLKNELVGKRDRLKMTLQPCNG